MSVRLLRVRTSARLSWRYYILSSYHSRVFFYIQVFLVTIM